MPSIWGRTRPKAPATDFYQSPYKLTEKSPKAVGAELLPPRQTAASRVWLQVSEWMATPPPPETQVPVRTTGRQLTLRCGQGGEARMRRTQPTPPSLAPGPPLPARSPTPPAVPRSRGEILTTLQRKYLRPFGATGALRQLLYSLSKRLRTTDGFTSLQWERECLAVSQPAP